jgi:hypothetical protein
VLLAAVLDTASAGPPSSCASKFVGTWAFSGGTTTVIPDGTAIPHCTMCVPVQTWTCQGNTYLFSNSGPPGQFSQTLIDSDHMQGSGGIATRISGGVVAAKPQPNQQAAAAANSAPKPQPKLAAQQQKPPPVKSAAIAAPSVPNQQSASCSDITGTGGAGGPINCPQSSGIPSKLQSQINQAQLSPQPMVPRVVILPPPQCKMCDVLRTVGEVLPDLAEKLDSIKPETINDVSPPLFDGGPNTLHPFLPRTPLAPITEPQDPIETISDTKKFADDAKALSDLSDKDKEAEDYAKKCQDGFLDAAWKSFTAKDGSYGEKAKAAKDSVKKCWKAAVKHIEDTIASGGVDPDITLGDN